MYGTCKRAKFKQICHLAPASHAAKIVQHGLYGGHVK